MRVERTSADGSMIRVLTTNPRSGTHYLKHMLSAALDILPLEADLSAPEDLRKAIAAADAKQLIYGHFRFSQHAEILDDKFVRDLRMVVLTRHPFDRLISQLAYTKALGGRLPHAEHSPQRMARDLLLGNWDGKPWSSGPITESYAAEHNFLLRDMVTDWLSARHCLLVKFEDLVSCPADVLAECVEFFGVALPREDIVRITERVNFTSLSGGRSPGQVDPESHYRKGVTGEWHDVFSPADLAILREKFATELEKAGYTL